MFQLFCIPLVGNDGDADNSTLEANTITTPNDIEKKKQELQTMIDGYKFPETWEKKAIGLIKDEKVSSTILNNAIIKMREEVLKNANNSINSK